MDFENAFNKFIEAVMNDISKAEINDLYKAIDYATNRAYYDMQLRTIKGHNYDIKKECMEVLRGKIKTLFSATIQYEQTDFDKWHEGTCKCFLDAFNNAAIKHKVVKQEYGKAQKIVNMSLKYLYCIFKCNFNKEFDDNQTKFNMQVSPSVVDSVFKHCHMPLDSYTLNWYYPLLECETQKKLTWSSLSYADYKKIQDNIRNYLLKHNQSQNVLQTEFIVWQQEKTKTIVNELRKLLANNVFEREDLKNLKYKKGREKNKIIRKNVEIIFNNLAE